MSGNTQTADVVIVGAGIVGCSTAYYLAKRGAKVVVVEKEHVAHEASGRNRGNVRLQLRNSLELPIAKEAVQLWDEADEELGYPTEFRRVGNLLVTYHESVAAGFGLEVERHRQLGLDAHVLAPCDLKSIVPGISPDIVAGFLTTEDGHVNPQKATWAYASAAQRMGVTFKTGCRAESILMRSGRVFGVKTSDGQVEAAIVLNAAGVRAPELMEPLGVVLPISPAKHQILVTARMPFVTKPYLRCAGPRVSFCQTSDGTLLLGMGPAQSVGFDTSISRAHIANVMRETIRLVPSLAVARVVRAWTGWFEMTPDDLAIVDSVKAYPGLFVCAGFSGHGFALGPAIGRLMAGFMLEGVATHPIDGFSLSRFNDAIDPRKHEPDSLIARLGRLTSDGLT
jgi:sarcosine oxidase subunit beta